MRNSDLHHVYRVVVPTTIYNQPAPADLVEEVRAKVKKTLAERFGGYTETMGIGGYVAQSGELIEERVYRIDAAFQDSDDDLVLELAEFVKSAMRQESVLIQKDHESWFV